MSLREMCQEMVIEVVLRNAVTAEDGTGRLQLIVDESCLKALGSFLKMSDLHAAGITSMELIERQREPLPGLDALYLCAPTAANIDHVLADFQSEGAPQHRRVHLVFSKPVTAEGLAKLAEGRHLASRVRSLLEIPLSFVLIQDRGFHFDMLECLPRFFPVAEPELAGEVARRLAEVCRCMQVTSPCIRHSRSDACHSIAQRVRSELSVYAAGAQDQLQCRLLIVDRSVDMAAALVHEYTYEASAYDLLDGNVLDIDKNLVTLKDPPREMLLSEADPLWEELKHMHVTALAQRLPQRVQQVAADEGRRNAASQETSDLLDWLRSSPEQGDMKDRLSMHLALYEQLVERLGEVNRSLGSLEQDIACGIDETGRDVKAASVQEKLTEIFSKPALSSESKLRLLMLFLASFANISDLARQRLIEMAKLEPEDQEVLMAMLRTRLMDVPKSQRYKQETRCAHRVTKEQAARFKKKAQANGCIDRFEPRIKELVECLTQDRLADEEFPTLGGAADDGSRTTGGARGTSLVAPDAQGRDHWSFAVCPEGGSMAGNMIRTREVRQRVVVFVLGGITHSELRAAAEVMQNLHCGTEVVLGGTALLTPKRLIRALRPREKGPRPAGVEDPADLT